LKAIWSEMSMDEEPEVDCHKDQKANNCVEQKCCTRAATMRRVLPPTPV